MGKLKPIERIDSDLTDEYIVREENKGLHCRVPSQTGSEVDVFDGQVLPDAEPQVFINKNVNWLSAPGAWTFIVSLITLLWLLLSVVVEPGLAWTYVHLIHGVASYFMLHWMKGSPIDTDQGRYDRLTFWEQLDDGVQYTKTRKFFTVLPLVLFLLATHGTDYRKQPLGLNLLVIVVLMLAKFPCMDKVRIFGINKY
jgi:hypothetical protein